MGKRSYRVNARCHHEGCKETAFWNADTQTEYLDIEKKYARNWKCLRHQNPEMVLSAENSRIVREMTSEILTGTRGESIGAYWERSGFVHGPGFRAYANDFPPGTLIRVTAEIIVPEKETT